jgi:hypothetical protein
MPALFPRPIIRNIANYFYDADSQVRRDLFRGRVVGERDYLSRYITLLEYPFGIRGRGRLRFRHLYFTNNFPGALEQRFGCDTFFIFRNDQRVKLLAIEGKYPRFNKRNYRWDSLTTASRMSHFQEQLSRQQGLVHLGIPVLEMFMNDDNPSATYTSINNLDALGSSFVNNEIAIHHTIRTNTWKHRDAMAIINDQFNQTNDVSIKFFITELLLCSIGNIFSISRSEESLRINVKQRRVNTPLLDLKDRQQLIESKDNILAFMKKTGIRNLGYIQY